MKNLSLKMDDVIFNETEKIIGKMNKNRNRYINEAVEFYNLLQKRRIISRQLQKESKIVQEESMKVLDEFEKLEDED
ncbi:MAG: hypothetical protein ACHQD7_07400 [Chitinophagales bacterium]